MKLLKEELLALDEIKKLEGWKILRRIFDDERRKIINSLTNIQTYELTIKDKKTIHTADNQMNEIRGRLKGMEMVERIIENAKELNENIIKEE